MSLPRYAAGRLLLGLGQVAGITTIVFVLTEALPGDAAVVIAGDQPDPARIAAIRAQLDLDRPAWQRYLDWLTDLIRGDLGVSLISQRPIVERLADSAAATLLLAAVTLLVLVPLAIALGMLAARREGGRLDRMVSAVSVALYAVPEFALAILLIAVFGVQLGWLPPTAFGADLLARPSVLVLPLLVLLARPICTISRLTRAGMLDALRGEHVRHARRLGITGSRLWLRHALPGALAPVVQQLARTTDWLLGGVIVVEAVFVIPGLGTALVDAVSTRDIPTVQALCVLVAVTTVVVNLAADLVAFRLAPRIGAVR
ncbi:ABC transporter permease [Micromonospora sediminimaris]|uniref:ABC transporter permease n=1 Tax=Micromonospora sediminimaris TaxID=547162 RepID=A0A9W5XMA0_9ACTN|nr:MULTISPECIES: ABC transporter permease [Micromonospora]WFE47935.1 ABC transporter permease [Verrucosispora sp. WMMD1129]GIJ34578.1 ABC transporter permease [Micromonospora sediminimaris]SFD40887.1 peptide/nickel transport system permease protein [Micromonospora sediminimaris]